MTDPDIVVRLRESDGGYFMRQMFTEAADEIERLREEAERFRAERDEARRRLCAELLEVEGHPIGWKGARGAAGIAERLGWDCFKETTP